MNIMSNIKNRLRKRPIIVTGKDVDSMTLRDYFAGQALAGMGQYLMENRDDLHSIAKACYSIADTFIEQREK